MHETDAIPTPVMRGKDGVFPEHMFPASGFPCPAARVPRLSSLPLRSSIMHDSDQVPALRWISL